MRDYELMMIIRPEVEVTEKKADEMVKKLISKVGATLTSLTVWGKRILSYPIQKVNEGTYILAIVQGEAIKSSDLEKETRTGTDILRFMLTVK